jgi:DNA-binding transcriptional MocR family regulator
MSIPIQYLDGARRSADIAAGIERAVAERSLRPGDQLPPVRNLATDLGVAPGTVAAAYRTLAGRGIVTGRGRQGTRITAGPPLPRPAAPLVAPGTRNLASGNPDPALLPPLGPALRRLRPTEVTWGDPHPDLDQWVDAARAHLDADGYPPGHVIAVAGALDGVERVLMAHLRPGDRVAVEDPGFPRVLDLVAALGLVPVPVAIDDAGPRPDALADALSAGLDALLVTPRAQNPYGAALDADRASALRRVLRGHPDVLVVEDDHAGPISGADAHPVVSAERRRWAVVRSVSKSLGPDLRLAALTGDVVTTDRVEGRLRAGPGWVSHLLQSLVVDLWADDRTNDRVARAERAYAERRGALVDALGDHGIEAHGRSGLNVWVPVPAEEPVVAGLRARGWSVSAGQRFRLQTAPAVRISIATLVPHDAVALATDLAAVLRPSAGAATMV